MEFIWQAEDGISLVAILRTRQTRHVIQGLHQSLFRAEKQIGLMVFGKGNIGSRWLELFAREQSNLSARSGFEFVLARVADSERALLSYDGLDQAAHWLSSMRKQSRSPMRTPCICGCATIRLMTW